MGKLTRTTKLRRTGQISKALAEINPPDLLDLVAGSMANDVDALLRVQSLYTGNPSKEIDFGNGITASLERPRGHVYWKDRFWDLVEYAEIAASTLDMSAAEVLLKLVEVDGWKVGEYLRTPAWMLPHAEVDRWVVAEEYEPWVVKALFEPISGTR